MPTRTCLICKGTTAVFLWPAKARVANEWTRIVQSSFPEKIIYKTSGLCYKHFHKETAFTNWAAWNWSRENEGPGASRLRKKEDVLPCLPDEPTDESTYVRDNLTSTPSTSRKGRKASRKQAAEFGSTTEDEDENQDHKRGSKRRLDKDYDPNESFLRYYEDDVLEERAFTESINQSYSYNADQPWSESKFIVPWSFLLWALLNCMSCGEKSNITVSKSVVGAALRVTIECNECGVSYSNCTSKAVNKRLYHINYLLGCAILFSGSLATKVLRLFSMARIHVMSPSSFFRYQRDYLVSTVKRVWERQQEIQVQEIKSHGSKISLAGDARCDSMGHSAKYSSYTLMNVSSNRILTTKLIQTTGNSNAMEMRGFKESLGQVLDEWKLSGQVSEFVSDRHLQVRKYMRETHGAARKDKNEPEITHYLDTWHVAKSLKKDLRVAEKSELGSLSVSSTGSVKEWSTAVVNHLYWVPCSIDGADPNRADLAEAKWTSLLNHIVNKHTHADPLFPRCEHRRRKKGDKKKKYLKTDSVAYELISDIINNKNRIKDMRQLSPVHQTSSLEAFHSLLNHFAPKMIHFHHKSQYTRVRIAAIHYNANADRDQEVERPMVVTYPKYKKGEATVRGVVSRAKYDYVDNLINEAFRFVKTTPDTNVPAPMSELHRKQDEDVGALKAGFTSRFKKQKT